MRINPKPHVWHIDVEGKGSPHLAKQRRYSTVYVDSSHCPKPDRRDATQAIEAAKELEAIVAASTNDVKVPCNFECSDFGLTRQHCEKLYQLSCAAHNAGLEFLADTGSEEDLISRSDHELYYSEIPIESASKHVSLMTANGSIQGDRSVTLSMPMIGQTAECYVLESTPPVCSVGRRCMDEGFEFHWYPGQPPYFIAPDGRKHRCTMRGRVGCPSLVEKAQPHSPQQTATASGLLVIRRSAHPVLKRLRVFSRKPPSWVGRCSGRSRGGS